MTRPPTLTDRQIQIIRENLDLFPPTSWNFRVCRHWRHPAHDPELPAPPQERRRYRRRRGPPHTPEQYMNRYGLESRFHGPRGVTGFIRHLETKIHLRAIERDNSENRAAW